MNENLHRHYVILCNPSLNAAVMLPVNVSGNQTGIYMSVGVLGHPGHLEEEVGAEASGLVLKTYSGCLCFDLFFKSNLQKPKFF